MNENETCFKLADLSLHGFNKTDVRRYTWHFYLCSHSGTSSVPKGWDRGSSAGPCLSSRQGPWARWYPSCSSSKASNAPCLKPEQDFCGWNPDSVPEPWGRGQSSAAGLGCSYLPGAFCQRELQGSLFRREQNRAKWEKKMFPSHPLPPDKTSVRAAACLCETQAGASVWPRAHQLHRKPPCSLAGYVHASVSCKPDFVHRTVTFKGHGWRVIWLFNQDINKKEKWINS